MLRLSMGFDGMHPLVAICIYEIYSPKCYYGRVWDFIWRYAPISIYIYETVPVSVIAPTVAMVVYGISFGAMHSLVFISMKLSLYQL